MSDNAEHFGSTGAQGRDPKGQRNAGQYGNRIFSSDRPQNQSETRSRQDNQQGRPQQLLQTSQRESVGEIMEKVQGLSLERGLGERGGGEVARGLLGTCLDMCPGELSLHFFHIHHSFYVSFILFLAMFDFWRNICLNHFPS